MNKRIGLDKYSCSLSVVDLLRIFQRNELCCFYVKKKENKTYFYTRIQDRKIVNTVLPQSSYEYTTGLLGMILRNFGNRFRILSYILIFFIWYMLSSCMFSFEVYGENDILEKDIYKTLENYYFTSVDTKKIKRILKNKYENKINWMEVYKKGNHVTVRYTPVKNVSFENEKHSSLIAQKNGMIAYFDCKNGYKRKQINDVVRKGEILVDSTMENSFGQKVNVEVSGKVMGYTWKKIKVEMNSNKMPQAIQFFSLLLEARNKINLSLEDGERIVKENVLQFHKNEGKIRMILLYTLLEDITS